MEQATVGAVNAHMSSLSVASVSADLSLWTNFLSWNFGPDGKPMGYSSFCCPADIHKCTRGGTNAMTVFSSTAANAAGQLEQTRKKCKEKVAKSVADKRVVSG